MGAMPKITRATRQSVKGKDATAAETETYLNSWVGAQSQLKIDSGVQSAKSAQNDHGRAAPGRRPDRAALDDSLQESALR